MADTWFSAKEWKARLVEFAGRRSLRNVANGETTTYDVSRSEGQVSQEGDAFNTKNMNDLEQRVANGFANAKTAVDTLNRDLNAINDSGAIKGMDAREDGVYITYVPSSGADSVTKKLGSGFAVSNYVFNYRVGGAGNGSSSGSQGRSGESRFVLDTKEYDTLTIGSYKIEGDGDHAAWNPNDAVAFKVIINGSTKTVGKGGGSFDVRGADSVTISATFNTNSNKDYGTWATLTVSSIRCL